MKKIVLSALSGAAVLALMTVNASAAIVCNEDACWHVKDHYDYPPEAHITVHEDTWKPSPRDHFTFREHEGRGYWKGGAWVDIH